MRRDRALASQLQSTYYLVGGVWPLIWYRSFEWVTGRKREPWLVKTVALLMIAIGVALRASADGDDAPSRRLGIGSALAFAWVDVWYGGIRRRISPIYLLDALVEAALVTLWAARARRS